MLVKSDCGKDKQVFRDEFGPGSGHERREFNQKNAFNFVHELLDARNTWAHSNVRDQITNDGVFRIAENAVRLLVAAGARSHALVAEDMMRKIGRRIYGAFDGEIQRKHKLTEQELDSTSRKLESTETELESTKRRLVAVEHERNVAIVDLEAARRESEELKRNLAETSHSLLSVERELDDAVRRLNLAERTMQAGNKCHSEKRRAEALAFRLSPETNEVQAVSSFDGERSTRAEGDFANGAGAADFTGQNLTNAQLANENLAGAILRDVDLSRANLAGADLTNAANLTGANLNGADLSKANLQGADLTNANMNSATLKRARLMGATLHGAIMPDGTEWRPGLIVGAFLR